MSTQSRNKVPPYATPDIPHEEKKPKQKHRDPVALPNGIALFKPSTRALLLNLLEVAKLAAMPFMSAAIAGLAFYTAYEHRGSGNEALFNGLGAVGAAIALGLLLAIQPALGLIQLKSARGELADFRDEFLTGLPLFWRYVGTSVPINALIGVIAFSGFLFVVIPGGILASTLALVGFLLLIIPGFIALHRYYLAPYYVLEQELGIVEALRASAADAERYRRAMWHIVAVTILIRLFSFVGTGGVLISSLLQLAYNYAPAVRYVEIMEANREIVYATRKHLAGSAKPRAKRKK